jgi:hypothetical protein
MAQGGWGGVAAIPCGAILGEIGDQEARWLATVKVQHRAWSFGLGDLWGAARTSSTIRWTELGCYRTGLDAYPRPAMTER